jgi:hypothetical protein
MTNAASLLSPIQQEFSAAAKAVSHPRGKASPRITLRLTQEEDARLRQLCEGMTVSAYVRQRLFGDDVGRRRRRSHAPVQDQQALAKLLGLLGETHIANNLNQLAYHANTGTLLIDEQTTGQINEAYGHVCFMRDALIEALGLSGRGAP